MSKVMRFYNPKTKQYEPINAGGVLDENTKEILTGKDISKKADKNYVDNGLSKKADKNYVDNGLSKKADKNYVDNGLSKKADKSDLDDLDLAGRTSTIVIANYDSHENSKKGADIIINKGENAAKKINDAIQSLKGTGGEVKLMEGNYNLEYGIAINVDGVHLTGIPGATILVQNKAWKGNPFNNNKKHVIDTWRDGDFENVNVEISNIHVKGANISDSYGFNCTGSSKITNCISENSGSDGFNCYGSSKITNCISENSSSNGFSCYGSSKVTNCISKNSVSYGFWCGNSSKVNNCVSENSGSEGFSCYGSSKVTNCISEGSGSYGFDCSDSSKITNCISENSVSYGFWCGNSSKVNNCVSENSGSSGFWCESSSKVNNCVSENSGSSGFSCYGSSKVTNCISENSVSYGFSCIGSFKGICVYNILVGDKLYDKSSSPAIVQYNIIQEGV